MIDAARPRAGAGSAGDGGDTPCIAALTVYPVKGCRGIAVDAARVRITGFEAGGLRDREWMVVDSQGRFVTQREAPRLALVVPSPSVDALRLVAPDLAPLEVPLESSRRTPVPVTVWRSHVQGYDEGDAAAAWLTHALRQPVRLVRFDPQMKRGCNPDYAGASGAHTLFSDGYPVLVIGAASLDDLNGRLAAKGAAPLPMNRFRPNLVIAGLPPYDEDHLEAIACGGVELAPVKPCVRCQVTTTDQASGHVGVEPLPTLAMYRRDDALGGVTFGMNAIVTAGADGALAVGAPVAVRYRF